MKRTRAARRLVAACTAAFLLVMAAPAGPAVAAEPAVAYEQQILLPSVMAGGDYFGYAVAVRGDTAVVSAYIQDDYRGAVYLYTRAGGVWHYHQRLVASDAAAGDMFGYSLALSRDTLLIGACREDDYTGAVYVFTLSGGTWAESAKLVSGDGTAEDQFGRSVAISGSTVLVGAPRDATQQGAAYIFTGGGDSWTEQAKLTAEEGVIYDQFGYSVALSGGTALIGAVFSDGYAGTAYIFTGSGSTWTERATLIATDRLASDRFGCSVAIEGETALIGAFGDEDSRGAAYVFTGSGGSWTQRTKLTAADGAQDDRFGFSVALSGGAAVVGADMHDLSSSFEQGAAYVFTGSGGSWTQRRKLIAADGAQDDLFGFSVALSGGTAVVGSLLHDTPPFTDQGAAYLHSFCTVLTPGVTRIAGANRYLTALAASKRGFPIGAPAVVVATGENWPDALGGSALAGAAHGPLLLTRKAALPAEVTAEIKRLGAVKTYVLGSTDAVSAAVEDALVTMLGRANVIRLGGANRYETARLVADETIRLRGATYAGTAFVATGLNYPDATAASPLAAYLGAPILLANVRTGTVSLPPGVTDAVVLGSEAAVPKSVYDYLVTRLTAANVTRRGGLNRYATAAMVAEWGIAHGMQWNGVGLATGENFPDALAAGPMLATNKSVLLLTRPTALPGETYTKLSANKASIASMFIFGDTNAVSATVEAAAKAAAGL